MNEILMRAVVEYAAFLTLTEDDDLNPDVAVAELEQLIAMLREMKDSEFSSFLQYIHGLLKDEKDPHRIEFLKTFIDNLKPEE